MELIDGKYKDTFGKSEFEIGVVSGKPYIKISARGKSLIIRHTETGTPDLIGNKVTFSNDLGIYFENINDNELKFGLILNKKPTKNIFELGFEGFSDFELKKENDKYLIFEKGTTNPAKSGGRVFEIVGPTFTDADGKSEIGELEIIDGKYIITIPQSFLDNAKYPIIANDSVTATATSWIGNWDVGDVAWTNPSNAGASDDVYATVALNNQASQRLRGISCGFSIPINATILGYEIKVEKKASGAGMKDAVVRLYANGNVGINKANTVTNWDTNDQIITYGGPTDLWGTTLTVAQINEATFGCFFGAVTTGNLTASVDHISITVYYSVGGHMDMITKYW